jgi:threonine/homoserine/homoserine lactone efflux protein
MNFASSFRIFLFLLSSYAMGFVAAIPVGAPQLEIARRSLNGFLSSSLAIVAGTLLSDEIYGVLALFGIAPLLKHPIVIVIFWLINAIILIVLGVWTIRQSKSPLSQNGNHASNLARLDVAFVTGFSLAITNPLMIVWWLFGARLSMDFGLIGRFTTSSDFLFLGAGGLGIATYPVLLAFIIHHMKKFISEKTIQRVTLIFGIVLFGLAAYILTRSTIILVR